MVALVNTSPSLFYVTITEFVGRMRPDQKWADYESDESIPTSYSYCIQPIDK